MPTYWKKVDAPSPDSGESDIFYNIYRRFWGKPLNFEQHVVSADDEDGLLVPKSFDVLTIDDFLLTRTNGRLIVRQEYLNAVTRLEERYASYPETGGIVVGHPGIGGCLHAKFRFVGLSAI